MSVLTVERLCVPHPRDVSWRLRVRVTSHRDAVSHGDVHVARKKIVIVSQHRHRCTHNRQHGCQNPNSITLSSLRPARLVLRWVILSRYRPTIFVRNQALGPTQPPTLTGLEIRIGQGAVAVLFGWGGNRGFGVVPVMRYMTLWYIRLYGLNGLKKHCVHCYLPLWFRSYQLYTSLFCSVNTSTKVACCVTV